MTTYAKFITHSHTGIQQWGEMKTF